MSAPADVRVFLLTYRRPRLLRRALRSLLAQTHAHWRCELHNDAPDDVEPLAILNELAPNDDRFEYRPHERNLGAVRSFNRVFAGGPEPLAALLEDDNWWEPTFLARIVAVLNEHPEAALAWTNMRQWREEPDGTWSDLGRMVWTSDGFAPLTVFRSPELLQAFDALHSNGAMVFRPARFRTRSVPEATPFAIIEQARERAAVGPLILIREALANFAITRSSARPADPGEWTQAKLLVAASFLQRATIDRAALEGLWRARRRQAPPDTDIFLLLAVVLRRTDLLAFARMTDFVLFAARCLRHPLRISRALRFRTRHRETWEWLVTQSATWGSPVATVFSKGN